MSKSYKKPYSALVCYGPGAQKKFRTQENRAKRKKVSTLCHKIIQGFSVELFPDDKEYGNEWISPRDGKPHWIGDMKYDPDPWWRKYYRKLTRK
jgi:hypothetical protein